MIPNNLLKYFKGFSKEFPSYFRVKNPNFFLMMRYYLRKPTFRYLLQLFFKNPFRIIFNTLFYLPKVFWINFLNKFNKRDFYADSKIKNVIIDFSKGKGFITISYCQKPFDCPDGRFSYKCSASYERCKRCFLYQVKTKCDKLNLDYYIVLGDLDSVWNILSNQFDKYLSASYILTTCNMVLNVVKYISPLFGFTGIILPFNKGSCLTIYAYELSEFGYKNVQTDISDDNKKLLIDILDKAIAIKENYKKNSRSINLGEKLPLLDGKAHIYHTNQRRHRVL